MKTNPFKLGFLGVPMNGSSMRVIAIIELAFAGRHLGNEGLCEHFDFVVNEE